MKKIMMNNPWLKLADARKIAVELQSKYFGKSKLSSIVSHILVDLNNHPLYQNGMYLKVYWDDFDCLLWLQITPEGRLNNGIYVPY